MCTALFDYQNNRSIHVYTLVQVLFAMPQLNVVCVIATFARIVLARAVLIITFVWQLRRHNQLQGHSSRKKVSLDTSNLWQFKL